MKTNVENSKQRLIDGFLDKASKHLQVANGHIKTYTHNSETIEAAQECIELSVKSIFLLLDIKYPLQHDIKPNRKQFSDIAAQIQHRSLQDKLEEQGLAATIRLPRLLFLLHFWAQFYTIAKYGFQVANLASARDLFDRKEAELAVFHAEECIRAARQLRHIGREQLEELLAIPEGEDQQQD